MIRNLTVEKVIQNLQYFSCLHKQKVQRLAEQVMFNKISTAQFRFIYHEITCDNNKPENNKQAEYDERIKVIIKNHTHVKKVGCTSEFLFSIS